MVGNSLRSSRSTSSNMAGNRLKMATHPSSSNLQESFITLSSYLSRRYFKKDTPTTSCHLAGNSLKRATLDRSSQLEGSPQKGAVSTLHALLEGSHFKGATPTPSVHLERRPLRRATPPLSHLEGSPLSRVACFIHIVLCLLLFLPNGSNSQAIYGDGFRRRSLFHDQIKTDGGHVLYVHPDTLANHPDTQTNHQDSLANHPDTNSPGSNRNPKTVHWTSNQSGPPISLSASFERTNERRATDRVTALGTTNRQYKRGPQTYHNNDNNNRRQYNINDNRQHQNNRDNYYNTKNHHHNHQTNSKNNNRPSPRPPYPDNMAVGSGHGPGIRVLMPSCPPDRGSLLPCTCRTRGEEVLVR